MERDAQKVLIASIRRLIRADQEPQLRRIVARTHPAELADVFGHLTIGQQLAVLRAAEDPAHKGEILSELEPSLLSELVDELRDQELSAVFEVMPTDDTNYVLQLLDPDRSSTLLEAMPDDYQSEATTILAHDPDSAGGMMVTEFLALEEDVTAGEAIRIIQKGAEDAEIVFYIYVINDLGQLVGVTSLRELVQQAPSKALKQFMIPDVIRVSVDTDQEDVARLVAKYNLLALPVVEDGNILVGVVTVDDIIDVIRLEANEDMLRMAGAGHEQDINAYRHPIESARTRLPSLLPGFVVGVVGVFVVESFFRVIEHAIILVAFFPVVLTLSRNVGVQSSTIVSRALVMGQVDLGRSGRIIWRELLVGLMSGTVYGLTVGGVATAAYYFFAQTSVQAAWVFGGTTGLGILVAMPLAAMAGALMPLLFDRWKLDPALATSPFFASVMDVLSLGIYLTAATLMFL
jgi:magnesium transporter